MQEEPQLREVQSQLDAPLIDMSSVDFMSEAIALEPEQVLELLRYDDLRCTDEDQVVDFFRLYLAENGEKVAPLVPSLLQSIRFDFVSTEKLIELSLDADLRHQDAIIQALCKRLAKASQTATAKLPQSISQSEEHKSRQYVGRSGQEAELSPAMSQRQ